MLNRPQLDPLLTKKFFTKPKRNDLVSIKVDFPLPRSPETLDSFWKNRSGEQFRAGVKNLVSRLKSWAERNNIDTQPLNDFLQIHFFDTKNQNKATAYFFYTEGVLMLASMIHLIESSVVPLNTSTIVIKNLIPDLVVCAPGSYTNIANAYLKLAADLAVNLMNIRRELAEQSMLELINIHNRYIEEHPALSGYDKVIPGNESHYVNSVLNFYADDVGIEERRDDFAPEHEDDIGIFFDHFKRKIQEVLTAQTVLERIIRKLELNEFKENIAKNPREGEYYEIFERHLNSYGNDDAFKLNELFDEDALAENKFILKNDAEYRLWTTLLHRLKNEGYVDLSKVFRYTMDDVNVYVLPNYSLKFAYIIDKNNQRMPFISYCIEQCRQGKNDILGVIGSNQQQELYQDMFNVLKQEALSVFCPQELVHSHDKTAWLNHFFKIVRIFQEERNQWLLKLILMLPDKMRSDMIYELTGSNLSTRMDVPLQIITSLQWLLHGNATNILKVIGFDRLQNTIENDRHLCEILHLLLEGDRLTFLAQLSVNHLRLIMLNSNNPVNIFYCLSECERIKFFSMLQSSECLKDSISSAERLGQSLSCLPACDWPFFLQGLLGIEHIRKIVAVPFNLFEVMCLLPIEDRYPFLCQLGPDFLLHFFLLRCCLDSFKQAGFVLSCLPLNNYGDFMKLLSKENREEFIKIPDQLFDFMFSLSDRTRIHFLSQLSVDHLRKLVCNNNTAGRVLSLLNSDNYSDFLNLLGCECVYKTIMNYWQLRDVLQMLPENNHDDFLKAFAHILPDEKLVFYRGDGDEIYDKLYQYKYPFSRVTSYVGSFFKAPEQRQQFVQAERRLSPLCLGSSSH